MNIILFTHPTFLGSQSMPRFAKMLAEGMKSRGHQVGIWSPKARLFKLPAAVPMKKWLGYVDQYVVFPKEVKNKLKQTSADTLFVFTDQALGPWVPLVSSRPHVIHCHDFMAQQSALGKIKENTTGWTGKQYQGFIRRGYSQGKNFLSVSENTRKDLHSFLPSPPSLSEVIYNGLNQSFSLIEPSQAREFVGKKVKMDLSSGYLLHVGGNQWYKNRVGVIGIYNAWREKTQDKVPLLMIGPQANNGLMEAYNKSPYKQDIYLLSGMDDEFVRNAYAGATVFIFPSLAEGFGWPIAEAMASGCPVVTTDEAPMTEVAGNAALLLARRSQNSYETEAWANEGASLVEKAIRFTPSERETVVQLGIKNAKRFDAELALDQIEAFYKKVMNANIGY